MSTIRPEQVTRIIAAERALTEALGGRRYHAVKDEPAVRQADAGLTEAMRASSVDEVYAAAKLLNAEEDSCARA